MRNIDGTEFGEAGLVAPLDLALAAAGVSRGLRNLQAVASDLALLRTDRDTAGLDLLADRVGAMIAIEGLVAEGPKSAPLDRVLCRLALHQQFATPAVGEMVTSLAPIEVDGTWARGLMMIVCELVHAAVSTASAARPLRLFLASTVEDGELVVAFASQGSADRPVPDANAARALRRAKHVVGLLGGGINRGFDDDLSLVGMVFDMPGAPAKGEGS